MMCHHAETPVFPSNIVFVGFSAIYIYTWTMHLSGITIDSGKYRSHLVVNNVTGNTDYKCSAENIVGSDDATCMVTVANIGKTSCRFASVELNTLQCTMVA